MSIVKIFCFIRYWKYILKLCDELGNYCQKFAVFRGVAKLRPLPNRPLQKMKLIPPICMEKFERVGLNSYEITPTKVGPISHIFWFLGVIEMGLISFGNYTHNTKMKLSPPEKSGPNFIFMSECPVLPWASFHFSGLYFICLKSQVRSI